MKVAVIAHLVVAAKVHQVILLVAQARAVVEVAALIVALEVALVAVVVAVVTQAAMKKRPKRN